jgi:uncharacterized protein (TIGR02391 family)
METLFSLFPDADELLKMHPEDLAPVLLKLALPQLQSAGFVPSAVTQVSAGDAIAGRDYPFHKKGAVDQLLSKTWNWIEREGFIEPAEGMNGRNGWRLFTEKGAAVAKGEDIQKLRDALAFPKSLLHPTIREASFRAVMRSANATSGNELANAVGAAFVAVEDAVRQAGGYQPKDFGAALMKAAFDPDTGPMGDRDTSKPKAEREGLQTLFIGAMNAYRNPVSHRTLRIELEEAKDQLLLASHLLRVVDARRPSRKP